jgi:predicted nucleic acid-binding protein
LKAYVDSSVVLRVVFQAPNALPEWSRITLHVSSALLYVECARTLDRLQRAEDIPLAQMAPRLRGAKAIIDAAVLITPTAPVLRAAAKPLPVVLKTLDSIHLATALLLRAESAEEFPFATHDRQLAAAARAVGFTVLGV